MLHKYLGNFDVKADNASGDVIISGWANKAVVDDMGDILKFDKVDMRRYEKNPILLYNHDRDTPIGKILETRLSPEGLFVKAKISNSKERPVSYLRDLVKEGILKTFSIGFEPGEEGKNADGVNEIKSWRLNEISIVTLPANIDAEFSLVKSFGNKVYSAVKEKVLAELAELEKACGSPKKPKAEGEVCSECGKEPCECLVPMLNEDGSPMLDDAGKPMMQPPPAKAAPEDNPEDKPTDEQPPAPGDEVPPSEEPKKPDTEEDAKLAAKNAFQECVSAKIPKLIDEGKPQDQAIAIAISMCSQGEGKCAVDAFTQKDWDEVFEKARKNVGMGITSEIPSTGNPADTGVAPVIDLAKAQLALLGQISGQLGQIAESLALLVAKPVDSGENEPEETPAAVPPNPSAPSEDTDALQRAAAFSERCKSIAKEMGI